jgi:hypothetical protein
MIELLVALAIAAAVLIIGVMAFQALSAGSRPAGTFTRLVLGTSVMQSFYGMNTTTVDAWVAPNYGCRARADILRDRLWEDVGGASAVFCLGRAAGVLNDIHPSTISVPAGFRGQAVDEPNDFLDILAADVGEAAATFTPYKGASTARNLTVFILQPSGSSEELSVRAVYDIDLVAIGSPQGTYVSGRRYVNGTLTDYYDVFFADGNGTVAFNPLAVAFERSVRHSVDPNVGHLAVATQRPFYFMWWPDPAMPELEALTGGMFALGDPRSAYPNMGGRTSLFFAVPMFPAL